VERLAAWNSIAGPLLASPLSSSLSAVVAELRRGNSVRGHPEASAAGRRRESQVFDGEEEGLFERTRSRPITHGEGEAHTESGPRRGRSLSGTLNDLWRGLRGGGSTSNESVGADQEEGGLR
jgi:hypothetical protein